MLLVERSGMLKSKIEQRGTQCPSLDSGQYSNMPCPKGLQWRRASPFSYVKIGTVHVVFLRRSMWLEGSLEAWHNCSSHSLCVKHQENIGNGILAVLS
ncbi:hypothetical protein DsansV1_C06g0061581 [Dioscorea sansibarensis]